MLPPLSKALQFSTFVPFQHPISILLVALNRVFFFFEILEMDTSPGDRYMHRFLECFTQPLYVSFPAPRTHLNLFKKKTNSTARMDFAKTFVLSYHVCLETVRWTSDNVHKPLCRGHAIIAICQSAP